jgi:hypothetical protein
MAQEASYEGMELEVVCRRKKKRFIEERGRSSGWLFCQW